MRDTIDYVALPDLSEIDFSCPAAIRRLVKERQEHMFGAPDDGYIDEYMDACDRWSRRRGQEISKQYGEGFRQYKGHPHPSSNLLLELLLRNA